MSVNLDEIREMLADPLGPNLFDLSLKVPALVDEIEYLRDLLEQTHREKRELTTIVVEQRAAKEDAYRQALANRAKVDAIEDLCNEWQLNAAAPTTRGHCADVVRQVLDEA